MVKTEEFDIRVPSELIAQEPVSPRDSSRLMVIERGTEIISHYIFRDLPRIIIPEETVLVFNNSRVIPARLHGIVSPDLMTPVTVVLLREIGTELNLWEALIEVGEVELNSIIDFSENISGKVTFIGEKIGKRSETLVNILFNTSNFEKVGEMPIPPYVKHYQGDPEKYQTVYSKVRGSAAAPTAGLHFTDRLLKELEDLGTELLFVTLHVGVDTFMPVYEETPEKHHMYTELYQVSEETEEKLAKAKEKGKRVIGVGTTSVRTLESAFSQEKNRVLASTGRTSLYILPGYKFNAIDGMITNFHYPRSTNLMMIGALLGMPLLNRIYSEAIYLKYRFYSFGDSTLVL